MSVGCSVCDGPSRPPERLGVEHHEGPVRAHADVRTFTVCHEHTAGHRPARDAVQAAIASRLTFAQRRRHGSDCAACGSLLDLPMRATTRSLTVEPPDGPPYTVTLALPLIRCGGCGVDNVPAELETVVHRCALSAAGLTDADDLSDRRSVPWSVGRRPFSRRRRPDGPRSPGPA